MKMNHPGELEGDPPSVLPRQKHESARGHRLTDEEIQSLRDRLREAQETLEAIHSGAVDAVVVSSGEGSRIYTLTSAEQPYRVYVEQMQEGAITVSADGVILYSNRKFAEFAGIELERVISASAIGFLGEMAWEEIRAGLVGNDCVKCEAGIFRSGGGVLPVMISATCLRNSDPAVICMVVTDLSAQKEKFELRRAKEVAEEANRAKDAFLAALSHELRTPLTPALMFASLLEREHGLPERIRHMAGVIRRNVELETRLIDDLLDLTRITRGKIALRIREMDLHEVIGHAVEICQHDFDDRDQNVELDLKAKNPLVNGDPVRIQQVLWNLIRNACKFSPRGLTVTIRTRDTGDGGVEVAVVDRGVGMEPAMLEKLFAPFEQGGQDVTRRYGGLGLGLVISKSIADLHEGATLQARSDGTGLGSTFVLTLRNVSGSITVPERAHAPVRAHLLLVEDNADTRLSLRLLLEGLRFSITEADSVAAGMEAAARERFDFLVSDIGLPDGTGYDLIRELRSRYGLRGIALSGYGMPEDIQRSSDAGFEAHLTKPILAADVEEALRKLQRENAGAGVA